MATSTPTHIDRKALQTNLHTRVSYLVSFIGLTAADAEALRTAAPHVRPAIPGIAEAMYTKLWSYDVTRDAFERTTNPHVPKDQEATQANEKRRYFVSFTTHWILKIFIGDWEDLQTFVYFDRVGLSHTGESAFRHRGERGNYSVDYIHVGIMLGFLSEQLISKIMQIEKLSHEEKTRVMCALTKVIWLQNDLMSRHYVTPVEPVSAVEPTPAEAESKCPFSASRNVETHQYAAEEAWSSEEELKSSSSDEEEDEVYSPAVEHHALEDKMSSVAI